MPVSSRASDDARAAEIYETFTGEHPEYLGDVNLPLRCRSLAVIGEIDYLHLSVSIGGKYKHIKLSFNQPNRPLFAVTPDRQVLVGINMDKNLKARLRKLGVQELGPVRHSILTCSAISVAECSEFAYTTQRDGVQESYKHLFHVEARPLLCITSDGSNIVMLGGAYDFTERGIVDKR